MSALTAAEQAALRAEDVVLEGLLERLTAAPRRRADGISSVPDGVAEQVRAAAGSRMLIDAATSDYEDYPDDGTMRAEAGTALMDRLLEAARQLNGNGNPDLAIAAVQELRRRIAWDLGALTNEEIDDRDRDELHREGLMAMGVIHDPDMGVKGEDCNHYFPFPEELGLDDEAMPGGAERGNCVCGTS